MTRILCMFRLGFSAALLSTGLVSFSQVVSPPITVPSIPVALAVDTGTGLIYIANTTSPTVTVFNPHTTATTSISVGSTPSAVAINPQAGLIFVANKTGNSVSVISRTSNAVVATTMVGSAPSALAVNTATSRVYVANFSSSTVSVLNASTGALIQTITVGSGPSALAVNSTTNTIFVANQTGNSVSVINGSTDDVTATLTVGTNPVSIGLNPITNKVFVANFSSNNVSVIDGSTNSVVSTVTAGTNPIGIAVNPVSNQIYAANYYSASITQIDGTSYAATTINVGTGPYGIAVNTGTNEIYVANNAGNSLSVINGASATVSTVGVGTGPKGIAVNSVDNHLYLADSGSNQVTMVDGSLYPTISVQTGQPADGTESAAFPTVVNPATNFTYLANTMAYVQGYTMPTCSICKPKCTYCNDYAVEYYPLGTVTVMNGNTGAITTTLTMGGAFPIAAAVNPVNNKIYVLNYFANPASPSNPTGNNSFATGTMTIINGNTNTVLTTINVGQLPNAIEVNPVTNKVYIADIGSGDPANPYPQCPKSGPIPGCMNFGVTPGNVVVVDGATNALIGSPVQVGAEPGGFAINQVTNKVYVYNFFSDSITAIDGSTDSLITTIPVGHMPDGIDVNPRTNTVYVANSNFCNQSGYTPGLTIINGANNTVSVSNLALDPSAGVPWAVVADPLNNKVYVSNANDANALNCSNPYHIAPPPPGTSSISVVNGATNSVLYNLNAGSGVWRGTNWGVLNPGKNKIYFSNSATANTTVIDGNNDTFATVPTPDLYYDTSTSPPTLEACPANLRAAFECPNEGGLVAVNAATGVAYLGETGCCYNGYFMTIIPESTYEITPLLSTIVPVVDSQTVQTSPVFVTKNATPSFTFTGQSEYRSYPPYTTISIAEPPPTALYYAIDTMEAGWTAATINSTSGANPASFLATLPTLPVGAHMLYVYSAYGREGTAEGGPNGTGMAAEPGNIATAYFVVQP
jgi:YVTN family beta-propeller protein